MDNKTNPANVSSTSHATLYICVSTGAKAIIRQLLALGVDEAAVLVLDAHDSELSGRCLDAFGKEVSVEIPSSQVFQYREFEFDSLRRAHLSLPSSAALTVGLERINASTGNGAGAGGRSAAGAVERMVRKELSHFLDTRIRDFLDRRRLIPAAMLGGQCTGSLSIVYLVEGGGQWGTATLQKIRAHVAKVARHYGVRLDQVVEITAPSTTTGRQGKQALASFVSTLREDRMIATATSDTVDPGFEGNDLPIPRSPHPRICIQSAGNSNVLFNREDRIESTAWFLKLQEEAPSLANQYFHNHAPADSIIEGYSAVGSAMLRYDFRGAQETLLAYGLTATIDWLRRDRKASTQIASPPGFDARFTCAPGTTTEAIKCLGRIGKGLEAAGRAESPRFAQAALTELDRAGRRIQEQLEGAAAHAETETAESIDDWWRNLVTTGGFPAALHELEGFLGSLADASGKQAEVTRESAGRVDGAIAALHGALPDLHRQATTSLWKRISQRVLWLLGRRARPINAKREAARLINEVRAAVPLTAASAIEAARKRYLDVLKRRTQRLYNVLAEQNAKMASRRADAGNTLEVAHGKRSLDNGIACILPITESIASTARGVFPPSSIAEICNRIIRSTKDPAGIADALREIVSQRAASAEVARDFVSYFAAEPEIRARCEEVLLATAGCLLPYSPENRPDHHRPTLRVVYAPREQLTQLRGLLERRLGRGAGHVDEVYFAESPYSDVLAVTEERRNLALEDLPEVVDLDAEFDALPSEFRSRFCTLFSESDIARNPLIRRGLTPEEAVIVAAEALALGVLNRSPGEIYRLGDGEEAARGFNGLRTRLLDESAFAARISNEVRYRQQQIGQTGTVKAIRNSIPSLDRLAARKHHAVLRRALTIAAERSAGSTVDDGNGAPAPIAKSARAATHGKGLRRDLVADAAVLSSTRDCESRPHKRSHGAVQGNGRKPSPRFGGDARVRKLMSEPEREQTHDHE